MRMKNLTVVNGSGVKEVAEGNLGEA